MIEATAPGKLYIAGEYAVLETAYPAIITALNRFIKVSLTPAQQQGCIDSPDFYESTLHWQRVGNQIVLDNRDNPFHYILAAIQVVESIAVEYGRSLEVFNLKITSELEDGHGRKYGLGSSAAVTVATVKALVKFYRLPLSHLDIFKLSGIAHFQVQGNGSLGDIAASVFGGWLEFSTFDKDWLRSALKSTTYTEILAADWPGLKIDLLTAPRDLALMIGWTGEPASTSHLVDRITFSKFAHATEYRSFLEASRECVETIIAGFHQGNSTMIKSGLTENRQLLQQLGSLSHVAIETPELKQLCDIAQGYGAAAKSSGAGGGDCGIALTDQSVDEAALLTAWNQVNIQTLPLTVQTLTGVVD